MQGIKKHIHANLSNLTDIVVNRKFATYVNLNAYPDEPFLSMFEVFPHEDFCIYNDYPFDQLVFTNQYCSSCDTNGSVEHIKMRNNYYTCTYTYVDKSKLSFNERSLSR